MISASTLGTPWGEVELMLRQLEIKYVRQDEGGLVRYTAPYESKAVTVIESQKNNIQSYTFVVRRGKKIESPIRLQLAKAMQVQNMRLKMGAFHIDMNDGEVLFVLHHRNFAKEKNSKLLVQHLGILWNVSHSTYNECMDKLIAKVAGENPGSRIDSDLSVTEADLVHKLLLFALMDQRRQKDEGRETESSGGESLSPTSRRPTSQKETAYDAQIRLIMQLLQLKAESAPPTPHTMVLTEKFQNDMGSFILDANDIKFYTVGGDKKILGQGAFGVVYHAKIFDTVEVAVKKIFYKGHASYETFKQEARVMRMLSNSNIVTFVGVAIIDKHLHIVSEYCNQGTLSEYLKKNGVTVLKAIALAKEAANGLNFLHKKQFIHRDVKPGNFLIHENHLKLADFGLTTLLQNIKDAPAAGTLFYLAPEVFSGEQAKVTSKVDVFSFGIVLWELLHPTTSLYPDIKSQKEYTVKVVTLGQRMGISSDVPPGLAELIRACWAHEPENRPTMTEVYSKLTEIGTEVEAQAKAQVLAQEKAKQAQEKAEQQRQLQQQLANSPPLARTPSQLQQPAKPSSSICSVQ